MAIFILICTMFIAPFVLAFLVANMLEPLGFLFEKYSPEREDFKEIYWYIVTMTYAGEAVFVICYLLKIIG